jgi:hypothetical protein
MFNPSLFKTVLWIRDIFSTYGFGSAESFFAYYFLKGRLHHSLKIKVMKKSQTVEIKVFLTSYYFCFIIEGDPDPDKL